MNSLGTRSSFNWADDEEDDFDIEEYTRNASVSLSNEEVAALYEQHEETFQPPEENFRVTQLHAPPPKEEEHSMETTEDPEEYGLKRHQIFNRRKYLHKIEFPFGRSPLSQVETIDYDSDESVWATLFLLLW